MSDNQRYWDLFVNRDDVYAVQNADGSYSSIKSILTHPVLFGDKTIGLYQLNPDNKVKWAVLDIDIDKAAAKDDPNFDIKQWTDRLKQQVNEASKLLKANNVPHYVEFSGFRGYHIWVFFDQPTEASVVKPWMEYTFSQLTKVDEHFAWELFPKQERLSGVGFGSLVKAPLQIHKKSGKRTYFVDNDFQKIEGLPDVSHYKIDPVAVKAATEKTKPAPKGFTAPTTPAQVKTVFPVPDNISKMLANCAQLNDIANKAETTNHLENSERVILANLGRFFGKPGIEWIHSVLQNCRDYDPNTTEYHITMLTGNPIHCMNVEKLRTGNRLCDNCRMKGSTPIIFGYTRVQQHFFAGLELLKAKKLHGLFTKMGLLMVETINGYLVTFNNNKYHIDKQSGSWLGQFNIVDFIRFVRPEDWELFIHQNYPELEVSRFTLERTDKKIGDIFPFKGTTITFNKHLSEATKEVDQVLTDDENFNMIAYTGSGKTFALIKEIQAKKLNAIFLTPYESTAKQLENKYKVKSVYGTVSAAEVQNYLRSNNLVVSTYDGLRKILESRIIAEDYILLIDEAHNLVTHSNFRDAALQKIFDNMTYFKKIINITGTPEGVLNNDYKNIKFVKHNQQTLLANYTIIETHEPSITTCVEHILNNQPDKGKVVIFKNNIKHLEVVREELIKRGVKSQQIKILNSNTKSEALFVSIVEDEKIPAEVKYVLTTSVISDGVNIMNQKVDAVYLLECQNLLLLRQFIARFRKGVKNVYDIIPHPKHDTGGKKWFDFSVELKRMTALYEKIADERTIFLNNSGLIKSNVNTEFLKNAGGNTNNELAFLIVKGSSGLVVVNYQRLTLDMLENFNQVAFLDVAKRKEYIDHFLNLNCNVEEMTKAKVDLTASKDKVKAKTDKDKTTLINFLSKEPAKTVTSYLQHVNQSLMKRLKDRIGDLFDANLPTSDFFNANKKVLKLKESGRMIEKYMLFHRYGFTHDFIIELLKKSDAEIYEFELGYYTQLNLELVRNHSQILKYNKKSLQVFHYAVFKFIYDFFQTHKDFTYDELLKEINTYLLAEKISNRKLDRNKMIELVNRMINKSRSQVRAGKAVKSVGWKFDRFKTISDLVDATHEQTVRDSITHYLKGKAEFMEANLFISTLGLGQKNDTALVQMVTEMRKSLEELTQKPPKIDKT